MKIVLDTNVLIAAFYQPLHRPCFSREVYDYAVEHESVYASPYILHEFRTKCLKKLKMAPHDVSLLEALITTKVHLENVSVEWILPKNIHLRDPKDLPILSFAKAIQAEIVLTWDKDLLVLKKIGALELLSPREFWDRLNES